MGKCSKSSYWREPGETDILTFSKLWVVLFHQIPILCFITREMYRFSHKYPIVLETATKLILWKKPGKLVNILFPSINTSFLSDCYSMIYLITWEIHGSSHQYWIALGNAAKRILWGSAWETGIQIMCDSLPSDFYSVVCSIAWKMHELFNQFLIAWYNVGNLIPWERTWI